MDLLHLWQFSRMEVQHCKSASFHDISWEVLWLLHMSHISCTKLQHLRNSKPNSSLILSIVLFTPKWPPELPPCISLSNSSTLDLGTTSSVLTSLPSRLSHFRLSKPFSRTKKSY
ncbi:hypothetical protein WA026_014016 [Henosepilachna vigintioctopunctata]|uniref:Uncharacterized protein n=1 Tax=Henosepilachna vigintioctopunctata TaxID=420089 RepID=A0AAW1U272_9CUCU